MNKKQQVMMSGGGGGVKTLAGNNERRRKSHPNSQQLPGIISSPPPSSSSPMHHTEEALREIHGTASLLEFVARTMGSLGCNLFLGSLENNNHYLGCNSQSSSCALSLLSWGTQACLHALDVGTTDSTTTSKQLIVDNNTGSNIPSFTHHLQQHQPEEQYFPCEKLYPAQSGGLGGMGITRDSKNHR